jgi:taurine dioxygenase
MHAVPSSPSQADQQVMIRPLTAALGAEVLGLDLRRPLDDALFARLRRAFLAHHLLVVRDQQAAPVHQAAFNRRLGAPQRHVLRGFALTDQPEVLVLPRGEAQGLALDGLSEMLRWDQAAAACGETVFVNQHRGWDALPAALQTRLAQLRGSPLMRRHPETGRPALAFDTGAPALLPGISSRDSAALRRHLRAQGAGVECAYRHAWRAGDVLFWDRFGARLRTDESIGGRRPPRYIWSMGVESEAASPGASAIEKRSFVRV